MTVDDLSIRALHRLDAANAHLRHSVVRACFYNLRVLVQELPGRRGDGAFARNLAEALDKVHDARTLITAHFAYQVERGVRIADLFPREHAVVSQALSDIESLGAAGIPARADAAACEEFAERVVASVDEVLAATDRIKSAGADRRIPLAPVLEDVVSIHRSALAERGIAIEFRDDGGGLTAFAARDSLLNALSELVGNAARHGFPAGRRGEQRIVLGLRADEDTRDAMILVRDTGCGMPRDRLARIGAAGASTSGGGDGIAAVRRVIEVEHVGLVTFESDAGRGTCVSVRLPRRAEPDLEAEPAAPMAGEPSTGRKAAAALALTGMVAIGVLLARHALRGPGRIAVAADGSGDYTTVGAAVAAARPGATIRIAPGLYTEHLILDKPVELVGTGDRAVSILATRDCAVRARADGVVLRNLRLGLGASIAAAAVLVESGDLVLENCEVTSRGLACVEVAGGAPTVRRCLVRAGADGGIFVHGGAGGLFEKNDIRGCKGWGIVVRDRAGPTVRGNRIRDCARGGISNRSTGRVVVGHNDVRP